MKAIYKLLIVDDKAIVLDGLRRALDWSAYNLQIVGTASDGQRGVELARSLKPNLIITDVKMPLLNGIDMIKKIRSFDSQVHFIILSGYDDFELAKKAFQYGAIDYLIKPVDLRQLTETLVKINDKLNSQQLEQKKQQLQTSKLKKSQGIIVKTVLSELMKGNCSSVEEANAKLQLADVRLEERPCAVLLLRSPLPLGETPKLYAAIARIEAFLETKHLGYSVKMEEDAHVFLVADEGLNELWLSILLEYFQLKFLPECEKSTIGVGNIYRNPRRIKYSYLEAERAARYEYLNDQPVVYYSALQDKIRALGEAEYPVSLAERLMQGLKLGDRESVQAALRQYFARIHSGEIEIASLKNRMIEMLIVIKKELWEIHVNLADIFPDDFEVIYGLQDKRNFSEIESAVQQFFETVLQFLERTASRDGKQVVQEVLRYIDEHFTSPDISIGMIADQICLTPNYVSALVKQVTGENFSDIVVKKRIERAKELLFDVTLKTYEVAEKVGYANANYFSSSFRKLVGITPVEFRNRFCN